MTAVRHESPHCHWHIGHVGKGTRFDLYFPAHLAGTLVKEAAALPKNLPGGTETIRLAGDEQDVRVCPACAAELGLPPAGGQQRG